jgi:hypothetical protein
LAVVVPALGVARASRSGCIKPHKVEIGREAAPNGLRWKVVSSVKNNGSCGEWLFGIDFHLPGVMDWGSGTGIPAFGHTSATKEIDAMDFHGPGESAFSGYVGSGAATIRAKLSDGERLEMPVRFPSKQQRQNHVWLRGFGYFVGYYAPGIEVISASAYDRDGQILDRVRNEEGFFF